LSVCPQSGACPTVAGPADRLSIYEHLLVSVILSLRRGNNHRNCKIFLHAQIFNCQTTLFTCRKRRPESIYPSVMENLTPWMPYWDRRTLVSLESEQLGFCYRLPCPILPLFSAEGWETKHKSGLQPFEKCTREGSYRITSNLSQARLQIGHFSCSFGSSEV
jgi:hypothetical protein